MSEKSPPYMVMVSVLMDSRGLPCRLSDKDVDDEYTIVGFSDDQMSVIVELFHYDADDLEKYKMAMMRDLHAKSSGVEPSFVREFKETHKPSPHPLWSLTLYDHVVKGHVYFACAHSDTLLIVYAGVDLTKPFKKAVQACKEQGRCTYSVTRKTRTRQYAFRCATCFPGDDAMVICEPCAVACHKVSGPCQPPLTPLLREVARDRGRVGVLRGRL